jgi:integrase/recombinase XerD
MSLFKRNHTLIPEPIIVPVGQATPLPTTIDCQNDDCQDDLRLEQVEKFLQTRSLSLKSQIAYRRDLQHFLDWTDADWATVTPRQIAHFKTHLTRVNLSTGQRSLSDATVRRILGTLKNFYAWLTQSQSMPSNPTLHVELPKVLALEPKALSDDSVEQLYAAAATTALSERNVALVSVLLHGVRLEEVSALNLADYDRQQLFIYSSSTPNKTIAPKTSIGLSTSATQALDRYLNWRILTGENLTPERPLFVSHSRRNLWQRLGYDGIRKVIDQLARKTAIEVPIKTRLAEPRSTKPRSK